jgi:exoribonuclease R
MSNQSKIIHNHCDETHEYYIPRDERHNLLNMDCYMMDLDGCHVDNGFSVYDSGKFLAIHIADPTQYFSPTSNLFRIINDNATNHYSMIPHSIISASSLSTDNENGVVKDTISVIVQLSDAYEPIGVPAVCLSVIRVFPKNFFTYDQAGVLLAKDKTKTNIFHQVSRIADCMYNNRQQLRYMDNENIKNVIDEFTIFANEMVCDYICKRISVPKYTHFTTPICHYLIKFIHMHDIGDNPKIPFTDEELLRESC